MSEENIDTISETPATVEPKPIAAILEEGAGAPSSEAPENPKSEREYKPAAERTVPFNAYHSERNKRKHLQEKLQDAELELEVMRMASVREEEKQPSQFWDDPDSALQSVRQNVMHEVMLRDVTKEHGAATVAAAERDIQQLFDAGHPIAHQLAAAARASGDPYGFAINWWKENIAGAGQQRQRQMVFPSNIAGARNVGSRSSPKWNGPTPLEDIFKR